MAFTTDEQHNESGCKLKRETMMTEKEALKAGLNGEKVDHIPNLLAGGQILFSSVINNIPPLGVESGYDWWGVHWSSCKEAYGNFSPTVGQKPIISDITKWREQLIIPDISDINWKEAAMRDTANLDPNKNIIFYGLANGIFERVHALMGFEDALCAVMEEPEEVAALADTIAEFYVKLIEKIGEYYKPDYLTFLDDYAYKDGTFISGETFDEVFAPALKKIIDAVNANGMKYIQHCCGKFESIFENFYNIGVRRIDPCQPYNDVQALQKKYPDVIFIGGLDTQNVVDVPGITEDEIRQEVARCFDTYGAQENYVFFPGSIYMYEYAEYMPGGKMHILLDESMKQSFKKALHNN